MASCDDEFALLGDDAQSHHQHHHHPQQQTQQQQHHPGHNSQPSGATQQQQASIPFVTHRYVTPSKGTASVPLHQHHHQHNSHQHLHHHQHQQQQHTLHPHLQQQQQLPHHSLGKKALVAEGATGDDNGGEDPDDDDEEDYGGAFAQHEASKLPPPTSFHDVTCFTDTSPNPFGAPSQPPPEGEDDDHAGATTGGVGDNNATNIINNSDAERKGGGAPTTGRADNNVKRRDRDELSDDGASPYCFVAGGGGGGAVSGVSSAKKPRPSSVAAAAAPSSSGDYRKDREEWSDSAISCLLDAYTDKYIQLNRGNLRGRDWEEVATIVSERSDKQKSCKSVEQCKNKVDNLKKRYKAERQRLSSGTLSASHWPWFKKMEQIVGSSSSSASSALSKPISDDDKSAAAAAVAVGGGPVIRQAKRYSGAAPSPVSLTNNLKMKSLSNPRWRRVVLKISGAAFACNCPQNIDPKVTMLIAREIEMANRLGVQVAVVVGGRNFFCGDTWVAATGIDRAAAYQIGMMATVMNSVLLQASLEKIGVQTRVQTTFMMQEIAEPYIRRRAIRHLEKGRVVIFGGVGGGTGNPLFTTDTAAALRASEINADAVLKGTNVDSGYDCHSRNNSTMSFEHISYRESLSRGFSAMDMTAITFCEENNIPVVVFNLLEPGNISRALCGDQVGTLIDQSGRIS